MVLKTWLFVRKLKSLFILDHTNLFKFHQHVVQSGFKECIETRDILTSNVGMSDGSREEI